MDESSWNGTSGEVKDSSANNNHGIASCSGAGCTIPTTASGKFGNAGTFAANGLDTVTIPSNSAFAFDAAGEYSVSVWLNPNSFVNHQNGTAIIALTNTGDGWSLRANGAGVFWVHFPGSTCGACSSSSTTLPTGIWSHAVFTYKNGSVNLYLNGTNILSTNVTDAISVTHDMNIAYGNPGCAGYGACAYNGKMDDLRVYTRALSASEVSTLYAYTPPDITSDLVAHWKMDESSWNNDCSTASVTDSSGTGNNGKSCPTGTGPTGGVAGKFSNAGNFDGVDDYITMNASASLENIPKITVSAWVNPDTTTGWTNIVSKYVYADGGWILRSTQAGNGLFTPHVYANGQWHLCSGASVPTASWTHLAFTYDGDTLRGYVNGIESCTNTNPSGDLSSNTTSVKIGGVPAAPGEYFNGKTDDVRVYTRALSASEVSTLYAYTPPDITSDLVAHWKMDENSWNGTAGEVKDAISSNHGTGTNVTTAAGKFNNAGSFNGTNGYVLIPDSASYYLTDALTLSAWFKPSAYPQDSGAPIIAKGTGAGGEVFAFDFDVGDDLRFYFWKGGNPYAFSIPNWLDSSKINNWYFVTATYNAGTVKIYVNGVEQTITGNGPGVPATLDTNNHEVSIGSRQLASGPYDMNFNGLIDDVRIYNKVLSSTEVSTLSTCTP